jgi:hypothetical protein
MPASVVAEMTAAVPDGLVADIVRGNRHNPSQPTSPVPQAPSAPVERGTGWIEERPHGPAPGLRQIDAIAEGFAERDRQELAKRLRRRRSE